MDHAALSTGLENSVVKLNSFLLSAVCSMRQATTIKTALIGLIFIFSAVVMGIGESMKFSYTKKKSMHDMICLFNNT